MADARHHLFRSRCAFAQLNYSTGILLVLMAGMAVTYLVPPLLVLLSGSRLAMTLGGAAWLAMAVSFLPMLKLYRCPPLMALLLPLIAAFYMAATLASAVQFWRGRGGAWKGRFQAAAARFVVIADASKVVETLSPPVPVELLAFGVAATLRALAPADVRPDAPPSPDGNLIADVRAPFTDPRAMAAWLDTTPGVVGHGLFAPELVSDVLIAGPGGLEHRRLRG